MNLGSFWFLQPRGGDGWFRRPLPGPSLF